MILNISQRSGTPGASTAKRICDIIGASLGLTLLSPIILLGWLIARCSTKGSGFFSQERIGRGGERFQVLKLRTMKVGTEEMGTVTTCNDPRITFAGRLMRRAKIDELPQLWNVLKGEMSLVGPRPDVPGFADRLTGSNRVILDARPGITGPASIAFRDEAELLVQVDDYEEFNRNILFPAKVELNRDYVVDWSLKKDFRLLLETLCRPLAVSRMREGKALLERMACQQDEKGWRASF